MSESVKTRETLGGQFRLLQCTYGCDRSQKTRKGIFVSISGPKKNIKVVMKGEKDNKSLASSSYALTRFGIEFSLDVSTFDQMFF